MKKLLFIAGFVFVGWFAHAEEAASVTPVASAESDLPSKYLITEVLGEPSPGLYQVEVTDIENEEKSVVLVEKSDVAPRMIKYTHEVRWYLNGNFRLHDI